MDRLRSNSTSRLQSRSPWLSKVQRAQTSQENVRGGDSTSPSGRGLSVDRDAVSCEEDSEGEDEELSYKKQVKHKGGKGEEKPLARLLGQISSCNLVDESTRLQLEMMAVQTTTMQQKVAQNELALEKTQLNDTIVLLK